MIRIDAVYFFNLTAGFHAPAPGIELLEFLCTMASLSIMRVS